MNKKLIYLISFISLFCVAFFVSAQGVTIENPLPGVDNFGDLFNDIAFALMALISALGTIMVIISGIFYLTSAGSQERMTTAKKTLIYGVVGMAVGLSAVTVINIVKGVKRGASDVAGVIENIAKLVGELVASLAVIMLIFAGILYLTSAGNPERIKVARNAFIYAVLGIIIGLAAPAIVSMVSGIFS